MALAQTVDTIIKYSGINLPSIFINIENSKISIRKDNKEDEIYFRNIE